ncbi:hypothetical protein Unana1_07676 [Umbelopsis nana]
MTAITNGKAATVNGHSAGHATKEAVKLSTKSQQLLEKIKGPLYSESVAAKVWGVAAKAFDSPTPPTHTPQRCTQQYQYEPCNDWTSGFFPGCVYALAERSFKYKDHISDKVHPLRWQFAARWWASNIQPQSDRTDTHDLGFLIQPAFRREYEVFGSKYAHDTVVEAAYSLATRFNEKVGAIKSWDRAVNNRYDLGDDKGDCLVIIDNMMNIDMLYWAAAQTGDLRLSSIGTTHAEKTLRDVIRHPVWSTYHLIQYDRETGEVRQRLTNQGYEDESCWSRGQAWAIHGFVDTYRWTKDVKFLDASINLADYFMDKVSEEQNGVPGWDFDAPDHDAVKDVSAAMTAAEGMIKIYNYTHNEKYLQYGLQLLDSCIEHCWGGDATFAADGTVSFAGATESILTHSTQNHYRFATHDYYNHGLVYADYYFLEIGNLLLDMGLIV